MIYDILYESCPWHRRASLFDEAGRLLGVYCDGDGFNLIEDAIVLGRVRKLSHALEAAFVDIGDVVDGFLPFRNIPDELPPLTEGAEVLLRVVRGRSGEKGALLSAEVMFAIPAENPVPPVLLQPAPGALNRALRDAGLNPVRVWVVDERFREEVLEWVPEDKLFLLSRHPEVDLPASLDEQLDNLESAVFNLPGGGRLSVEVTRALTAFDVDMAGATGKKEGGEHLKLEVNLHAAAEVARLCQLLDVGGSVVVDFITLTNRQNRRKVQDFLEQRFAETSSRKVDVLKMSRYGLVEINREKGGQSLLELLCTPTFVAGRILLNLWRYRPGSRSFLVEASEEVASLLRQRLTTDIVLAHLAAYVEVSVRAGFPATRFCLSTSPGPSAPAQRR